MLPVELPETDSFSPRTFDADDEFSNPESPLDRLQDWVKVELDLGDGAADLPPRHQRDAAVGRIVLVPDALPRPDQRDAFVDPDVEQYWMGPRTDIRPDHPGGVDLYVGGVEHAVLHLLYARFWHKVLFDLGHVSRTSRTPVCSTRATSRPPRTRTSARSTSRPPRSRATTVRLHVRRRAGHAASGARWARA